MSRRKVAEAIFLRIMPNTERRALVDEADHAPTVQRYAAFAWMAASAFEDAAPKPEPVTRGQGKPVIP